MSCLLSFWSHAVAIESRAPPTLTSVILERSDGIHTFLTNIFQGQVFAYLLCGDTPQRPAPSCHAPLDGASPLTNLSLDVNISRSQGLTTFDCSLEKLTSRSKNTRTDLVCKCFAVKTFLGQKPFLQEETLVTVSPCEFPPRVLITCVLSEISRNYNRFFLFWFYPCS